MVTKLFHFTIGPVQSFVSQARRTRDLWAGSFLLSWLAGQAMAAVFEQEGTITFPDVGSRKDPQDPLLKAIILGQGTPLIGSIPNRFKAVVPDDFDPTLVTERVQGKWYKLAGRVYAEFVAEVAVQYGLDTEAIWNRQIENIWEMAWILGQDPGDRSDNDWLEMRKNWRSHWPEPEGGDHCLIMSDFQEISGYTRVKNRSAQKWFWEAMQKSAPDDSLDIRDNERLCAIAVIKRLFPRLGGKGLADTIGWTPGGDDHTVGNWPSTTYMACVPWLIFIAKDLTQTALLQEYIQTVHDTVNQNGKSYFRKLAAEQATRLSALSLLRQHEVAGKCLDAMDGAILHHHALQNHRTTFLSDKPLPADGRDPEPEKRSFLRNNLTCLYAKLNKKPRSYYALLLMDGDRLGKMLQNENQQAVSRALLDFTRQVDTCVTADVHSGITIYAGGDDVLALLPLNNAIACAMQLNDLFRAAFKKENIVATASCAVLFAHHQMPLRIVLAKARHHLEEVAKDANGRDSLALAILKPSGITASWVSCWDNETGAPVSALGELIRQVEKEIFPRGFFHKLRDRYGFYEEEKLAGVPAAVDYQKLLVAEYMQSRDRESSLVEAGEAVKILVSACKTISRDQDEQYIQSPALTLAGGFIARFLTQEED